MSLRMAALEMLHNQPFDRRRNSNNQQIEPASPLGKLRALLMLFIEPLLSGPPLEYPTTLSERTVSAPRRGKGTARLEQRGSERKARSRQSSENDLTLAGIQPQQAASSSSAAPQQQPGLERVGSKAKKVGFTPEPPPRRCRNSAEAAAPTAEAPAAEPAKPKHTPRPAAPISPSAFDDMDVPLTPSTSTVMAGGHTANAPIASPTATKTICSLPTGFSRPSAPSAPTEGHGSGTHEPTVAEMKAAARLLASADQNEPSPSAQGLSATDTNSCSLSTITTATAGSTNVSRSTTAEETDEDGNPIPPKNGSPNGKRSSPTNAVTTSPTIEARTDANGKPVLVLPLAKAQPHTLMSLNQAQQPQPPPQPLQPSRGESTPVDGYDFYRRGTSGDMPSSSTNAAASTSAAVADPSLSSLPTPSHPIAIKKASTSPNITLEEAVRASGTLQQPPTQRSSSYSKELTYWHRSCAMCNASIAGKHVFMLHDQPFCTAECRLQACRAHAQAGNNNNNNSKHGSSANLMDDKSGGGQGGGVHRSGSAVSIASSVGSERSNSSGLYATFKPWC